MKPGIIPQGLTGKALFEYIVKNEQLIIHAKKSEIKKADAVFVSNYFVDEKGTLTTKAASQLPVISENATQLKIDVVINTTNYFDSHSDVHIPGIWNKSLSDNKKTGFYLLERHLQGFQNVIGDALKGTARKISWNDLGFDYTGITEALMFSGIIDKSRNPFMFDQYAKRYVKQHSVGMRYVRLVTCINDDDYPVQKENWDKYIKYVINASDAEDAGVFWAVLEAKVNEGSAVLFGSNDLTPTQNVEEVINTNSNGSTGKQPLISTDEQPQFNLLDAIKSTTFLQH